MATSSSTSSSPASSPTTSSLPVVSDQQFLSDAFEVVLGRPVDPAAASGLGALLANGASRTSVASVLTHSDEYFASLVRSTYREFLGRDPDASGLQFWVGQMHSGLTDERLEADVVGSQEFYNNAGGTDLKWVDAMYATLLGRAADPSGESYWTHQLGGGANRAQVALGFATSSEHEAQVIRHDYQQLLGRSPGSAGEVNYWVQVFEQGMTNEDIIAAIVGSSEFSM